jgi:hypothetical protein
MVVKQKEDMIFFTVRREKIDRYGCGMLGSDNMLHIV